ncbi:MAG: hypothetical protein HY743_05070 [Deltaproteobacteria bacterium]|nr:hypothetical protein [Deltaproteobacteria bacterium]
MSGLANLPKAKWSAAGKQPGLKPDMVDIERGILESFELRSMPQLISVDATAVKVSATADSPARLMMAGFPDVLHPGQFLPAGLSDGKYRANTGDVAMDFDVAANRWGTEKASQWYAIYALAANADTTFTLKAMPWMRYSSQASQVITLRNNLNTANIGYGFTTDELVGGKILILSGASKGLMRSITANNNDNGLYLFFRSHLEWLAQSGVGQTDHSRWLRRWWRRIY